MYEETYGGMSTVNHAAEMSTSEMIRNRFGHDDSASITATVCKELKELYDRIIKPVEKTYGYEKYKDSFPLAASYFDSKPIILVVGPKSSGKSTFIRRMVGMNYPGLEIGNESNHKEFTIVCHDHTENLIPGQVVVTNEKYHFQDVAKFGRPFLERFNMSTCPADVLKDLWFVDTPRIDDKLDAKDKEALLWFASKATRIILLFDPKKLDFNSEMQSVLRRLSSFQKKFCVVLNKSSGLHEMQLVKHYGTLMWNLCNVIPEKDRKEEMTVYITSFSLENQDFNYKHRCAEMFDRDAKALLDDLHELPKEYTKQKLNTIGKRGKKVMFHAKLMVLLRERLPKLFGKRSAQHDMKENITQYLEEATKRLNVKPSFFQYMNRKSHLLFSDNLKEYKPNKKAIDRIQALIGSGIPVLLKELQGLSSDLERDKALIEMGLKKGKVKKLKAKKKKQLKAAAKKKIALQKLNRSRAGSIGSTKSKRSVMSSVASIRNKVKSTFSFKGRRRKKKRDDDMNSQFSPGSIMDDAMSTVYGGNRMSPSAKGRRQMSYNRQTGPSLSPRSIVEKSVVDDHLDLYTVMSGDEDDLMSITSRNTTRKPKGKGVRSSILSNNPRPKLLDPGDDFGGDDDWAVPGPIRTEGRQIFNDYSNSGKLEIDTALRVFGNFHVSDRNVRKIWELIDFTGEGWIDADQCAVAVFLLKQSKGKKNVPKKLEPNLIPPRHR